MQSPVQKVWLNKNYRYAIIISILMLVWLGSGFVTGDDSGADKKSKLPVKQSLTQVRAKYITAEKYPLQVMVKGKTEADRYVDIKAEVTGQVDNIAVEKGQLVKTGDVICHLAIEDRGLRYEEAKSSVEQVQIEYDGALRLKSGGYQSATAIASAKAKLDTAKAILLRRKIDLEKISIRAPFDGVVDKRPAEVGALMRAGDTCATVLDLNPLVVSGQVSEADVIRIPNGSKADIHLVTGEKLTGEIRYISRSADEMTRTYRVEVAVENSDMLLFSGVTAEISIYTGSVNAHLISASLLILADNGSLGLRVLDDEHKVVFHNVSIVGDSLNGVWVTGLPESSLLITVGQEYVGVGEKVDVTFEDKALVKSAPSSVVEGDKIQKDTADKKGVEEIILSEQAMNSEASELTLTDEAALKELNKLKNDLMQSEEDARLKILKENADQIKSELDL